MLGTLYNVVTVAAGSSIGLVLGRRVPDGMRKAVFSALGLFTLFIGIDMMLGITRPMAAFIALVLGAVLGHMIMGHGLSFISIFGMVALSGVVVNDSIVLVDYYNKLIKQGVEESQAVVDAAVRRFRPILLTTTTTALGLLPMLLETSVQAQFLIPMAISLAFGIVVASVMIILLVPALTMIAEEWRIR